MSRRFSDSQSCDPPLPPSGSIPTNVAIPLGRRQWPELILLRSGAPSQAANRTCPNEAVNMVEVVASDETQDASPRHDDTRGGGAGRSTRLRYCTDVR